VHRFVIHGVEYGVGGVGFRDDPHLVRLADLGLRPTERFAYDYDFTDGWRLDLRLEQILVMDPGRVYPGEREKPWEAAQPGRGRRASGSVLSYQACTAWGLGPG
jgi:hypothetical protein